MAQFFLLIFSTLALLAMEIAGHAHGSVDPSKKNSVCDRLLADKFSALEVDDYVLIRVNPDGLGKVDLIPFNRDDLIIEYDFYEVAIGKYVSPGRKPNTSRVSISIPASLRVNSRLATTDFEIPNRWIDPAPFGNRARFENALFNFQTPKLKFYNGEGVRFRNPQSGGMDLGIYKSSKRPKLGARVPMALVEDRFGKTHEVGRDQVFKETGHSDVSTPKFGFREFFRYSNVDGSALRVFLNYVALLTSSQDFRSWSTAEQLQALVKFVHDFLPWNDAAFTAENYGIRDFSSLLTVGVAACRHLNVLLALALSESGFSVSLAEAWLTSEVGHLWVEVALTDLEGHPHPLIADSITNVVFSKKDAGQLPQQFFHRGFYANPRPRNYRRR